MKVFTLYCEYDIGINNNIFSTKEVLIKYAEEALIGCGLGEYTVKELEDAGLLKIYPVNIVES